MRNSDDTANDRLAYKIRQLGQSLDMREGHFEDGGGDGSKKVNANDQNAFMSNTTYHSYMWSYCRQWVGQQKCKSWWPPLVSKHSENDDRSPAEDIVGQAFKQTDGQAPQQNGDTTQYAIWDIKAKGSILDKDGKLDDRNITDMRLTKPLQRELTNLGEETAQRNIDSTVDGTAPGAAKPKEDSGVVLTSMETLRTMASRWTLMLRNRLVSNLGEARVARPKIEFALGENRPTCDSYLDAVRNQQNPPPGGGERLTAQAQLDMQTRTLDLGKRYDNCMKMQQAASSMVNPQLSGDGVQEGSADNERMMEWRTRMNLAMVDQVGIRPDEIPHPADAEITQQDLSTQRKKYDAGGLTYSTVAMTNEESLRSYNRALKTAAAGVQEAALRNPFMTDYSDAVMGKQIALKSVSATQLNDMTQEMKANLAGTSLPRMQPQEQRKDPVKPQNLDRSSAELVVTKLH